MLSSYTALFTGSLVNKNRSGINSVSTGFLDTLHRLVFRKEQNVSGTASVSVLRGKRGDVSTSAILEHWTHQVSEVITLTPLWWTFANGIKWGIHNKTYENIHQDLKLRKKMRQISEWKKWLTGQKHYIKDSQPLKEIFRLHSSLRVELAVRRFIRKYKFTGTS
jgi:hypothetical protein